MRGRTAYRSSAPLIVAAAACSDTSGTVFCNGAGTAAGNAANNKAGGCAMIYP